MLATLVTRVLGRGVEPETIRLGRKGERLAARHLKRAGFRVLARNVRLGIGEADIVCEAPDRKTVVIVEVKTRLRGTGRSLQGEMIAPEASVHQKKRHKLAAIARVLIKANKWEGRPVRIDVVAVECHADGSEPVVRHHEGIRVQR